MITFLTHPSLSADAFCSVLQISGVSMKMPDSTESEKTHNNTRAQIREDSEYVRLVIPNELKVPDAHAEPQAQSRRRSLIWWIKAIIWSVITIILLLVFVKYGVPFLVEKVL